MRISVYNRHKNDEDKIVNTVEINGETFYNIPNISDIDALKEILNYLGAKISLNDGIMTIDSTPIEN